MCQLLTGTPFQRSQARLGWRTPVNIEHVEWGDLSEEGGRAVVEVQSIKSSASLWDMARGQEYEVVVSSPRVDGSLTEDGDLRLQRVAQVHCCQTLVQTQGYSPSATARGDEKLALITIRHTLRATLVILSCGQALTATINSHTCMCVCLLFRTACWLKP